MARFAFAQTEQQSCTAVSIMVTLAERGKIPDTEINRSTEMKIWAATKRSSVKGQEEIMPHSAMQYLTSQGMKSELCQDKSITKGLKAAAAKDYAEYKSGLQSAMIARQGKLDISSAFKDDARVFVIVGFFEKTGLKTHTVLMRKDNTEIWVMNPDGGTDNKYTESEIVSFLSGQTAPVPFAGRNYLCAGIAYRVW